MLRAKPSHALTRWLFLRGVGLVYLIAFGSCAYQLIGLIGHNGLLPADRYLQLIAAQLGDTGYLAAPSVAWFDCSDFGLELICWAGMIAALCVVAGVLTAPALLVCYVLYLSLISVGQAFLSYQWDWLLLETGFICVFLAPWRLTEWGLGKKLSDNEPPILMIWMVRLLVLKLMFMSGLAKIASGDPTWANLTALNYHYWTQPLPTPLGWLAGQLPEWMQKLSVVIMFAIELVAPFLIFINRYCRFVAAVLIIMLQVLIGLTGNYTFFNLLSIVLCIPLLDDHWLAWVGWKLRIPGNWKHKGRQVDLVIAEPANFVDKTASSAQPERPSSPNKLSRKAAFAVRVLIATLLVSLNVKELTSVQLPGIGAVSSLLSSFGISNTYGLFAVMTTTRNEIVLEGSNDKITWLEYEFPFKPGDIKRAPPIVAPYQPRLDWQLWFASLSTFEDEPWFGHLVYELLKGDSEVLHLFSRNPFPNSPPRYIRASFYDYKFTDLPTLLRTGEWWHRTYVSRYFPIASLQGPDQGASHSRSGP